MCDPDLRKSCDSYLEGIIFLQDIDVFFKKETLFKTGEVGSYVQHHLYFLYINIFLYFS